MSRIRTVKPDLFRHEELFQAEIDYGLPIRIAFIALFTVCDREGRFKWRPRQLKLDCLPYDELDFSRVLDVLTTRGFVKKYSVLGVDYGLIPSFSRHQVINNRESDSELPDPPTFDDINCQKQEETPPEHSVNDKNSRVVHASDTRHYLAQAEKEGKGREKEREGEGEGNKRVQRDKKTKTSWSEGFCISESVMLWYTEKSFSESIQAHFDSFKNKCLAKGYQYADWDAAFRNAISDDWAGLRKSGAANQRASPSPEYIPPEMRGSGTSGRVIDSTAERL